MKGCSVRAYLIRVMNKEYFNLSHRLHSFMADGMDYIHIQRNTMIKVPKAWKVSAPLFISEEFGFESIYTQLQYSIYTQHRMSVSSKRVFRLRVPIGIQWPCGSQIGYELLPSTADHWDHKKRKHNRRSLILGRRRQKGLFIAPGICRRLRVRIVRPDSFRWGLPLLKRFNGFLLRLLTETRKAGPAMKELINSSPIFYPPAF